jgi:SAM-dependent methyltransferase
MEKLKQCLICGSEELKLYQKCIDYLVSKEEFVLNKCQNCGFVFTSPRPTLEEIGPYYKSESYYSHSDSSTSIISSVYNFIRSINIKRKLSLVQKVTGNKGSLLDYGCGAGLFVKAALKAGWKASGVEPNEDARIVAKKHSLEVESPEYLDSVEENSFDVISLWHVLEHLHDIEKVIQKLKFLLKDDGVLIIAVPNINSWDAKKYKGKWAAYDVPRHLCHFSPETIGMLFAKVGMRVVSTYPMKFDSYYVSLLSEDKSVLKYVRAFVSGFRSNISAISSGDYSSLIYIIK